MKALIVNENRIAQVEQDANIFEVVPEWQWVSCPDDCTPEWTYDGSTFYEPVQPPIIVTEISTAQGHLALIEYGKYQAAVDFINAIPDPIEKLKAEVNFYRRNDWQRDNPTLLDLALGLGISDSELDQMFIFGSTQ